MITVREMEKLYVDISLGLSKDDLRVKIDSAELEQAFTVISAEVAEARAKGWVLEFSNDNTENPDFEPTKDLD